MTATRRLWTRRMVRAGWLLAPILAAPGHAIRFIFENLLFILMIGVPVGTFGYMIVDTFLDASAPTTEQVKHFLKDNTPRVNDCMTETMKNRIDYWKRPATVGEFKAGVRDCVKANNDMDQQADQLKAIADLKK